MLKHFRPAYWLTAAALLVGTLGAEPGLAQPPQLKSPIIAQAAADISPQKEALIREYLDITQASAAAAQMMEPLIPVYKNAYPSVPDSVWDKFMTEIASGSLADFLVPVFAKHLTIAELEASIAFYQTPEGASMLSKMPALMQDSQQAGALWGAQLGEQILQELESGGYLSDGATSEI